MSDVQWTDLIDAGAVPEGDVISVVAGDQELALYRVAGEVFATSNVCTHGQARLCDGWLEGHEIECPLHQGRFDIRNGHAMCAPLTENLRVFAVRVERRRVHVAMGPSPAAATS